MIAKGSRIKLIHPMGMFDKIGEICEVANITEDAVITFKCSFGIGCMSYDELDRYFEVEGANITVNKKPKRTWSDWKYDTFVYYNFGGTSYTVPVKYRNNGKVVDLRTDYCELENREIIKTKASCNKNDRFNLETGLDIADARLQIKLMQKDLQDMIDEM